MKMRFAKTLNLKKTKTQKTPQADKPSSPEWQSLVLLTDFPFGVCRTKEIYLITYDV